MSVSAVFRDLTADVGKRPRVRVRNRRILDALLAGSDAGDLALREGCSLETVRRVARANDVPGARRSGGGNGRRTITSAEAKARSDEILRLYTEEFLTYEQIGGRFGITRERVRQILARRGDIDAARRARIRTREERERAEAEARREEIRAQYRETPNVKTTAQALGLKYQQVASVLDLGGLEWRLLHPNGAKRRLTPEMAVRALQACAADLGHSPSSDEYDRWARGRNVPSVCSVATHLFPRWRDAKRAAGQEPWRENRVQRSDFIPLEDCLDAVRELAEELGHVPSAIEYDRWSRGRSDVPSAPTVRNRLPDRKWKWLLRTLGEERGEIEPLEEQVVS